MLVSSHLISEIEQICDYVVMIRAGRLARALLRRGHRTDRGGGGFAWLLAVENIIARIVPGIQQRLPGQSILAVASGGGEGVSYAPGLILGAAYLVVAIAAATTVFVRSDVTA